MKLKRFILTVFAMAMVFSATTIGFGVLKAEALTYNGAYNDTINWSFNDGTGELTISGTGAITDTNSDLPWRDYMYSVKSINISNGITSIGKEAFRGYYNLTNVTISGVTLTEIGDSAFSGCNKLEKITLPNSLKRIGSYAFNQCYALENITIPDSVTEIGDDAFSVCRALSTVTIPAGVTIIDNRLFERCENLNSVTIKGNITSIGTSAFEDCKNLETLSLPDNGTLLSIGDRAFSNCENLKNITIPYGVTTVGDSAFIDCRNIQASTIPDSITSVGQYSFTNCEWLESIPENLLNIGSFAFSNCDGIKNIKICKDASVASDAFGGCSGVEYITVDAGNQYCSSDNYGVLYNKDKTAIILYPASSLNSEFIVPDSVSSIGRAAFSDSTNLVSVTIPDSVTSIGNDAFSGCSSLENLTLGKGVKTVGVDAFRCQISADEVFENVYYTGTLADWCDITFEGDVILSSYSNPMLLAENLYINGELLTDLVIPEGLTSIKNNQFNGCDCIKNITFHESITEIGKWSFYKCSGLTKIIIPDSVIFIHYGAFSSCKNLKKVEIGSGIEFIDSSSFIECNSLEYIHISSDAEISVSQSHPCNDSVYICSNSDNCGAKDYAGYVELEFRVCNGHDGETDKEPEVVEPEWIVDNVTGVECLPEEGCYDSPVSLSVSKGTEDSDIKTEFQIAISGKGGIEEIYNIRLVDSDGNVVQPQNGKKVTIKIKAPKIETDENEKIRFFILHRSSANNGIFEPIIGDSLKEKDGYLIFDVTHFSYFAVCVANNEPDVPDIPAEKTVSSISIASLPAKTSYIYRMDSLDLLGLALTVTYSDGTTETITDTSKMKVTGFDNSKAGTQTVTVEYEGVSASFDVTVSYVWWQWIIRILLLGFLWY